MRLLVAIGEFLLAIYLAVNWGADHGGTPGSKVVLGIIAFVVICVVMGLLELAFTFITRGLDSSRYNRSYGRSTFGSRVASDKEIDSIIDSMARRNKVQQDSGPKRPYVPMGVAEREAEHQRLQDRIARAAQDKV